MKIHAIRTGTVAITTKWREGVIVVSRPEPDRETAARPAERRTIGAAREKAIA